MRDNQIKHGCIILNVVKNASHMSCDPIGAIVNIILAKLFNFSYVFVEHISVIDFEDKCDVFVFSLLSSIQSSISRLIFLVIALGGIYIKLPGCFL